MMRIVSNRQAVSNILGYSFSFAICSLIMMSAVLTTTSIIDTNSHEAAALEAQALANQVADAIIDAVLVKQSLPEADYQEILTIPRTLAGSNYYVEIDDTEVYVNTTDGEVSRVSSYYTTKDLDFSIRGKISGGSGGMKISYEPPVIIYKLDFGTGNITHHSPVESGYYMVTDSSLSKEKRNPPWWNNSDVYKYRYRIAILVNNTVPPEYAGKYTSSDLTDIPIQIVLTPEDIDYDKLYIYETTGVCNCFFYDPLLDKKLPYYVDYVDSAGKTVFLVNITIKKDTSKYIYLYYGGDQETHSPKEIAEFYDDFGNSGVGWNKTYNGGSSNSDIAKSIAHDSGANVYVVGYGTGLNDSDSGKDWWIKKFDLYGYEYDHNSGWNKTYDGGGGDDVAYSVATYGANSIYVVGSGSKLNDSGSGNDWWIMKFDSSGNRLWNKTYDSGGGDDVAYSVATDDANNVCVVGSGYNLEGITTDKDWWIMKFDSSGNRLWNKTYDGNSGNDEVFSVATDSSNNVTVAGYGTNLVGGTGEDWWIKKYLPDGTEKWEKKFDNGTGNYVARSVTTDRDDNIYVVGYGENLKEGSSEEDWWIKKYRPDETGTEDTSRWNKIYHGSSGADRAYSAVTDYWAKNVYVAGYGTNLIGGSTGHDWWLKKFGGSYGGELKSGLRIDPDIWHMSNINSISSINSGTYGKAELKGGQYIITKDFNITPPPDDNVSMYIVEMKIRLEDDYSNASMILLSGSNESSYKDPGSYRVSVGRNQASPSEFMIYKYQSWDSYKLNNVSLPAINEEQWIRLRSYVYLNNTYPIIPDGNTTFIGSYLYDYDTFTPYERYVSRLDDASVDHDSYLSGSIGIATNSSSGSIIVDWIRVLRTAPSFQPSVSIGAMESINYNWRAADVRRESFDRDTCDGCDLFSPGPVNRDFIDVPKYVERMAQPDKDWSDFNISHLPQNNYLITVTVGNRTGCTLACNLSWAVPPSNDFNKYIPVPETEAGQFKNVWFTQTITEDDGGKIVLRFDRTKAVSSIIVERTELSNPGQTIQCTEHSI